MTRIARLSERVGKLVAASGVILGLGAGAAFAGSFMSTGGLTSQPIGHYEFCQRNAAACAVKSRNVDPSPMTNALYQLLVNVNASVNAAVKPMSDIDVYGRDEYWAFPVGGVGDCEDYVLEKQAQLLAAGVPLANLLITVVRKPDGEGHAVLTVRSDDGDYVLDNLNDEVLAWQDTGYTYLKRQSGDNSGRWVVIRKGQTPMVAAVK